jgi:hypothetical protein
MGMNNSKWAMAIVAVCLVVTVAAVAYAAEQAKKAPPEVVQAQRFELVDAQGRVRGEIGMGADGRAPSLVLRGEKGEMRAMLALGSEGNSALALMDGKGETRAALSLLPDASPYLVLTDGQGKTRAGLAVLADGGPGLMLYDKGGTVMWRAP